jgi:hypothetical protein
MSNDNTYNGWRNWATWNMALWLDNDEETYRMLRRAFRRDLADIQAFLADNCSPFATGTPDMDPGDVSQVDWDEIREAWIVD